MDPKEIIKKMLLKAQELGLEVNNERLEEVATFKKGSNGFPLELEVLCKEASDLLKENNDIEAATALENACVEVTMDPKEIITEMLLKAQKLGLEVNSERLEEVATLKKGSNCFPLELEVLCEEASDLLKENNDIEAATALDDACVEVCPAMGTL